MASLGEAALIVVPTYNERANVEQFVRAVRKQAPAAHVLVVDDGSPDGTGDIAEGLAADDRQVSVLHRKHKLGLGTAYLAAFERGLTQDFEHFVQMDADFSHDPRYLPEFLDGLAAGADVVLGSRNIRGGRVEGWGIGRHLLSKGASLYSRAILGVQVRDLTSGYKAFSRKALEAIDLEKVRSNGYSFQIEMTYRALARGLTVLEVPIVFVDRRVGESKMDQAIVMEAVAVVWKLRAEALAKKL
jgi:dolichol-phosphate mannosyltransferase